MIKPRNPCRHDALEVGLQKGIAPRIAMFGHGRIHFGEAGAVRRIVARAIAGDDMATYLIGQRGGLQRAQPFIVKQDRLGQSGCRRIALDKQALDCICAQQIGREQAGRPRPDNEDGHLAAERSSVFVSPARGAHTSSALAASILAPSAPMKVPS